jgi:serine/threonine protein kinase
LYNGRKIENCDYDKKLYEYFHNPIGNLILAMNSYNSKLDYEIISKIKENLYTCVYKAKITSQSNYDENEYVAVKKIFKDKIKEEMILTLCKERITEEDFKPEIEKFNKEIHNMELCACQNSVKIYDYYDIGNEFIIIMELCDDTLFNVLARTENGFSPEEIKEILLQLNNVFKLMNHYNISHRDIKLNNILVKYLNQEKTKYKVLLSDYGVSNQLYSMTQKLMTHIGTQLIMAPEILNDEEYTNKCDLWSLGVIIFQMYTKQFPYVSRVEKGILNLIDKHKQTILNVIKDEKLKNLLSKLLVKNPEERMSWDEYFKHPFFN